MKRPALRFQLIFHLECRTLTRVPEITGIKEKPAKIIIVFKHLVRNFSEFGPNRDLNKRA